MNVAAEAEFVTEPPIKTASARRDTNRQGEAVRELEVGPKSEAGPGLEAVPESEAGPGLEVGPKPEYIERGMNETPRGSRGAPTPSARSGSFLA